MSIIRIISIAITIFKINIDHYFFINIKLTDFKTDEQAKETV